MNLFFETVILLVHVFYFYVVKVAQTDIDRLWFTSNLSKNRFW